MRRNQSIAAQVVLDVLAGRSLTDELAGLWKSDIPLGPDDHGAIQDLTYGTLRHLSEVRGCVDFLAERTPTDRGIEALLWVAFYQLIYSRNAPHAVVNEAVAAAARSGKDWARGFVNALLRRFLRERDTTLMHVRADPQRQYSYPEWWIERLRGDYPDRWIELLAEGNRRPPMTLRVNRRMAARDDYIVRLQAAGRTGVPLGPHGILLDTPAPVSVLPGFDDGWVSVQDYGAQLAAPRLDVTDGMRVLDACAAPGGKTAHLLELADLELLALDQDAGRLQRVEQNLRRLRLGGARLQCADAGEPSTWWDAKPFQRVLLDAPCSASGVVRRHPDSKWLRRASDIPQLAAQQRRLLEALWQVLEPGGKLLYVTCSIFKMENEDLIANFLRDTRDAERVPAEPTMDGADRLLPTAHNDGFFHALLRKRTH